jgi:hypothetical protein
MRGALGLRPLFPGWAGGEKPLLFTTHKPCQMWKKKPRRKAVVEEEALRALHVTRW